MTLSLVISLIAPARAAGGPPVGARTGEVDLNDHALRDDGGEFLGLGASYFQALRRAKYDRQRYRSDLSFLARCGFNYIRTLSMVGGNSAWGGKEIAPLRFTNDDGETIDAWDDYDQQLRDMIDIAYDEHGIRTQITLFADAQHGMPEKKDRIAHLQRVLESIRDREHKVMMLEVANEAWQNGFPGDEGVADLRQFGQYLADRTEVLVALSAPDGQANDALEALYAGSAADIATGHFTRDVGTVEGGWLPVRDVFRVTGINGIPPVSSNEPIGPGASVNSENDPIKLAGAAAYAWMSGLPMYVFHSSAGVSGDTRFQDMAGADSYRHFAHILPGDIANWKRAEGAEDYAPFITFADGKASTWWTEVDNCSSGAIRHLSCVKGDAFYTLPIGILPGGLELEARADMTIQVFDPLTGQIVLDKTLRADQRFRLAQGPQAYLIRGRYASAGDD